MRHISTLVLAIAFLTSPLTSRPASAQSSAPSDFLQARKNFNEAGARGDKDTYARYLAPDVTWINVSGGLRDHDRLIADVRGGSAAALTPIDVVVYPGGVVITGLRTQNNSRFIQAWVNEGGRWMLVAHQASPVGSAPPENGAPVRSPSAIGSKAELDAIRANIDASAVAGQKADIPTLSRLIADKALFVGNTGVLRNKQTRLDDLKQAGPGPAPVTVLDVSTRIHGNIAVTIDRSGARADGTAYPPSRRTLVHVKQNGQWLQAASIITKIVQASR
jgi:ketosteroid isomerase-like protein